MPTAPLGDLLDEMAATLQAVLDADLGTGVGQVTGRRNFNPTPPSLDMYPGDPSRDDESAGFSDFTGQYWFTVRARVSTVDDFAGQDLLLRLMDDEDDISVAAALMDDQTLNGFATSVKADGPTGFVQYADPGSGGAWLGCEWRVRVLRAYS